MVGLVETTGQHDNVVHLWLRRPSQGNALDPETVNRLHYELSAAESRPECLAVVVRAEGSAFCAGADVKACMNLIHSPNQLLAFFAEGRRFMDRLVNSRLLSIAVVQGLAAAGGLELVTATDFVIATDSALFADRHTAFGFLPAFGATSLLPLRVGDSIARSMLFGKRELDATAAQSVGLVHRICSAHEVDDVIEQELSHLRSVGVGALTSMKHLINSMEPTRLELETSAVRRFSEMGGYDPSRFIGRAERGQDSAH